MQYVYLIITLVMAVLWGVATQKVIDNKGYSENWFWWGFFFGLIALLVALSKQDQHQAYTPGTLTYGGPSEEERILRQGGWKCTCGRVNASYTSLCACGKTRGDVLSRMKPAVNVPSPAVQPQGLAGSDTGNTLVQEAEIIDLIRQYKGLLDAGAITEQEFRAKKAELLGRHE